MNNTAAAKTTTTIRLRNGMKVLDTLTTSRTDDAAATYLANLLTAHAREMGREFTHTTVTPV